MIPEFKTILQLTQRFPTELSCHQYLASRRWNGYMQCPYQGCGNDKAYVFKDGIRYKCTCCRKIYTAKTGTIMESSKLPTIKWFLAMYLLMHKKGISSVQLSKDIGVTQKTGWFILQRLRKVFSNDKPEKLEGVVELDESFVGGKNKNRHHDKKYDFSTGRRFDDKVTVFGMLERGGKVIAMTVKYPSKQILKPLIYQHIHQGTTLMTDEFNVYNDLKTNYHRQICCHSKGQYANDQCWTNGLENFWSHLKRGLHGSYISVSPKHLNKYVQEFTFRHNYRTLGVQQQIETMIGNMECRLKYKDLIA